MTTIEQSQMEVTLTRSPEGSGKSIWVPPRLLESRSTKLSLAESTGGLSYPEESRSAWNSETIQVSTPVDGGVDSANVGTEITENPRAHDTDDSIGISSDSEAMDTCEHQLTVLKLIRSQAQEWVSSGNGGYVPKEDVDDWWGDVALDEDNDPFARHTLLPRGTVFVHKLTTVTLKVIFCNEKKFLKFKQNMYQSGMLREVVLQKLGVNVHFACTLKLNGITIEPNDHRILILDPEDTIVINPVLLGGQKKKKGKPKAIQVVKTLARKIRNTTKQLSRGGVIEVINGNSSQIGRAAEKGIEKIFSTKYANPVKKAVALAKGITLSSCAMMFAAKLLAPWDPKYDGACNPALGVSQSQKINSVLSFDATVGTGGVGFIAITGCNTNTGYTGFFTTSAFTGQTATILTANNTLNTGVLGFQMSNLPYSSSQASVSVPNAALVSIAPVCIATTVTYVGTTMNESGMIYCFHDPAHENVSGMSINDICARSETEKVGVSRKPCTLIVHPISGASTSEGNAFVTSNSNGAYYPFGTSTVGFNTTYRSGSSFTLADPYTTLVSPPVALIMFTGVAGSQFHVDVKTTQNAIGQLASQAYTPHGSDIVGAEQVQSAMLMLQEMKMSYRDADPMQLFSMALRTTQDGLKKVGVPASLMSLSKMKL